MGLDMFVFSTKEKIPDVDFEGDIANREELFYWRKHPNLHGWMEKLYRAKGGEAEIFNCVAVKLDSHDIDLLEEALAENSLPETTGFFFGVSDGYHDEQTKAFIVKARDAIAKGNNIFYTSWW